MKLPGFMRVKMMVFIKHPVPPVSTICCVLSLLYGMMLMSIVLLAIGQTSF